MFGLFCKKSINLYKGAETCSAKFCLFGVLWKSLQIIMYWELKSKQISCIDPAFTRAAKMWQVWSWCSVVISQFPKPVISEWWLISFPRLYVWASAWCLVDSLKTCMFSVIVFWCFLSASRGCLWRRGFDENRGGYDFCGDDGENLASLVPTRPPCGCIFSIVFLHKSFSL